MPKVKIFWVEDIYLDEFDRNHIALMINDDEFEEVTPEELQMLQVNRHAFTPPKYNFRAHFAILDDKPIAESLTLVRAEIEKIKARAAKEEARRKASEEEKRRKKAEKEHQKFLELKKKYEKTP